MGSKVGLAELKMIKEDGTLFSRLEMEQQLREETVYNRRLRAFKLGLPNKIAQHMLPISVTHWILDHWVHSRQIRGEILGIRAEFDADDNKEYVQQLGQRLMLFVEHGLAVSPNPGEGIDMTQFPGQPGFPPMPPQPNGQPAAPNFTPPPPPPMPGMPMPGGMPPQMGPQSGMMPPMPPMPGQQPAPNYPPQQQGFPQPPMPPMPQQPPQQGYAPPPVANQFPPGYNPQQAQQPQHPQQGQQVQQPTKVDPTRQWGQAGKRDDGTQRNRRTKEELAEDAVYEAWVGAGGDRNIGMGPAAPQPQPQQPPPQQMQMPQVPQQPQMTTQMVAPPNPFGAGGVPQQPSFPGAPALPQMPQMAIQPAPQQPMAGGPVPTQGWPAFATEDQVGNLENRIKLLEAGIAMLLRVMYQKDGPPDLYQVLTEVCKIRP